MPKYEVGVYRTSFNSIEVESLAEEEAIDFALRMEGTGELELFPDKRAEAIIEGVLVPDKHLEQFVIEETDSDEEAQDLRDGSDYQKFTEEG